MTLNHLGLGQRTLKIQLSTRAQQKDQARVVDIRVRRTTAPGPSVNHPRVFVVVTPAISPGYCAATVEVLQGASVEKPLAQVHYPVTVDQPSSQFGHRMGSVSLSNHPSKHTISWHLPIDATPVLASAQARERNPQVHRQFRLAEPALFDFKAVDLLAQCLAQQLVHIPRGGTGRAEHRTGFDNTSKESPMICAS